MSDEYERGRRDGLRLGLTILAAEQAKWAALLCESRSWRTNVTREVRHRTLEVAESRVRTTLKRITPKSLEADPSELREELKKVGLQPRVTAPDGGRPSPATERRPFRRVRLLPTDRPS